MGMINKVDKKKIVHDHKMNFEYNQYKIYHLMGFAKKTTSKFYLKIFTWQSFS